MTDDVWSLVLGVVLFTIWVCVMTYGGGIRRAHTLGRTDKIQRINRTVNYKGLARLAYTQGRRCQAKKHRLAVYDRRGLITGDPAKSRYEYNQFL